MDKVARGHSTSAANRLAEAPGDSPCPKTFPPIAGGRRAFKCTAKSAVQLFAIVVVLATCGCRRNTGTPADRPSGFIAVVGAGQDDPLWPVLRETARRVHADLGVAKLPLRTMAPETSSADEQKRLIERLVGEGMVSLCVQVADAQAIAKTLDRIAARGIGVVTMMRSVKSSTRFLHSGPSESAVGTAMAEAIVDALRGSGTVAVLHADSVSRESAARRRGLMAALDSFSEVHVILDFDCRADPIVARRMIRETMKRFPRLSCWAITGNWPLQVRGNDHPLLPPTCRIVSVHPTPDTWPAFATENVFAMIASDYKAIAEHAIITASSLAMGSSGLSTSFFAATRSIRQETLEEFKSDWHSWTTPGPDGAK